MTEQFADIETILRGGAAGVSLLLAITLGAYGRRSQTSLLAALFCLSTSIYVLISGATMIPLPKAVLVPLAVVAIWGTVFFWWFGASLFDDNFRWRWWRFAPLILMPPFFLGRIFGLFDGIIASTLLYIHLLVNALLFADVLRLAIVNAADDLVDPRRRFRIIISVVIAVFGISIAIAEMTETTRELPDWLVKFQAAAIFALNLLFGAWLLAPRTSLFLPEIAGPPVTAPPEQGWAEQGRKVPPGDRPAYERLMALMDDGVYREESLSVAALAEKVGVPEHQLRKLINGALRFRNFSSFLNARRIEDAKAELADGDNARKQILQIALDLGYGSIAPFNRAFKMATGQTPTEFRKSALGPSAAEG
ncbi:helix-turn-helix domain-containing protein [Hyphococcus sp.]|uniref:helix-turn-helix domain-containing protein n=1 Tax=Hyphococcus sp. TaxID=2038636 RepID=UPI002081AA6B|nr:MAG: transcriptional regulator [Marinicaulis sp.]